MGNEWVLGAGCWVLSAGGWFAHAGREYVHQIADVAFVDRLVERDVDRAVATVAEVDLRRQGSLDDPADGIDAAGDLESRRIEVLLVDLADAERRELLLELPRVRVDARRDARQPCRSVIDGIQAGD